MKMLLAIGALCAMLFTFVTPAAHAADPMPSFELCGEKTCLKPAPAAELMASIRFCRNEINGAFRAVDVTRGESVPYGNFAELLVFASTGEEYNVQDLVGGAKPILVFELAPEIYFDGVFGNICAAPRPGWERDAYPTGDGGGHLPVLSFEVAPAN